MKAYPFFLLLLFFLWNCKTNKKEDSESTKVESTILEEISNAHGYKNWKNVEEIAFTFNVDRDSTHFSRSWIWQPKTNGVTHISGSDTLRYNRKTMDSIAFKTNAGFINDRYWLLAPFNLIWDKSNFTYDHLKNEIAPISKETMQKLTIVYGNEGGYTPGDAYDFYFDDDYIIREWVFRKGNQVEPSMTTTWEGYNDIQGFKFVRDHKKEEGNFNLYIDNIAVKLN